MSSSSTGESSSRDACACGSAFSSEHPFGTASSHGSNTFGVAFTNGETLAPAGSGTVFGPAPTSSLSSASVHGQNLNLFGTAPTSLGFSPPIFGKSNDCFGTAPTSPGFSPPVFRQSNVCFGTAPTSPLFSPPIFRQSNDCFWTAPSPGFSPPIFGQSNDCFGTRTSSGFTAPRTSSVFGGSGFTAPRTSSVFGGSGFTAPRTSSGFGGRGLTTPRTSSMFGGSGFTAPRTSSVFGGSGFIAPRTSSGFTAPRTSSVFGGSGFTAPRTSSGFAGSGFTAPFVEQSSNCWRPSSSGAVTFEFGQIGYSPFFPTSMQAASSSPIHGSLLGDQVKTISGHSSFFGPTFGVNRGGSRSASYTATDMEGVSPHEAGRILSISAMPVYKDKCLEELRWEDYQFAAGTWGKMPVFDSFRPAEAPIGSQSKGSKVEPYTRTQIDDAMATSISAMPVYRDKSHEELRWEDYQFNGSGGRLDSASVQFNAIGYPVDKTSSSFLNTVPSNSFFQPKSEFQTCNPLASNNLFNNPHGDPYTSITQSPLIAGPRFPVSHPHPSDISLSAGAASTCGPNLFNRTSSNSSTSGAAPVTASVPCIFPPTTSLRSDLSSSIPVFTFADAHKTTTTASKELPVQMRDNSRALVSGPPDKCNIRVKFENMSIIRNTSIHVCENGEVSVELSTPSVDGSIHQVIDGKSDEAFTAGKSVANGDHSLKKEISSNVYELMPKVKHSEYFTEPRVEELALKESLEPGFCSQVKDFVVGHGRYGSIKFLGETDVRRLDINSHIVFSDHEVVVYMDESKKPPVGQGLNKAAEITLCNIKCIDKDGNQYINGPKVDEYKQKLIKFAADEGAKYVSYDPVQGEWKFRVEHF